MYEARQNKEKVSRAMSPHMKDFKSQSIRLKDNRIPIQMYPPGKRVEFTLEEDQLIINMCKNTKPNWRLIAEMLVNRTPRQVRDRYVNYLDTNIKHGPWSKEEDELLIRMFGMHGNKWSIIQQYIPNRNSNQIKNRASRLKLSFYRSNTMGNPANFYSDTFCNSLALLAERGEYDVFSETFLDPTDKKWYDILGRNVDVGDTTDAVKIWNDYIRFLPEAEREKAIAEYRKNPANFRPENSSNNRSNGAKLGERYLAPPSDLSIVGDLNSLNFFDSFDDSDSFGIFD